MTANSVGRAEYETRGRYLLLHGMLDDVFLCLHIVVLTSRCNDLALPPLAYQIRTPDLLLDFRTTNFLPGLNHA